MSALVFLFQTAPPHPNDAGIKKALESLHSPEIEAREEAVRALVRIGRRAVLPLEKAARHPDPEVAARAREALEIFPRSVRYKAVRETCDLKNIASRLKLLTYAARIGHYDAVIKEVKALIPMNGDPGILQPDEKRSLVPVLLGMGRRALKERKRGAALVASLYPQFLLEEFVSRAQSVELGEIEEGALRIPLDPDHPPRRCEVQRVIVEEPKISEPQ